MIEWGFRKINSKAETRVAIDRLNLERKTSKPVYGSETGLIFTAKGLSVYVWTTFVEQAQKARDEDEGWVCIVDGDLAVYFSEPLHRTKNFFKNLARKAWIARYRVLHRPVCEECRGFMNITKGRSIRSRYWSCHNIDKHQNKKPSRLSWDYKMPPRAQKFLDQKRKKSGKYNTELKKSGKETHQSIKKRNKWTRNPSDLKT